MPPEPSDMPLILQIQGELKLLRDIAVQLRDAVDALRVEPQYADVALDRVEYALRLIEARRNEFIKS